MINPSTDPVLSVLVPLPSDLARTIDTSAGRRGQDRVQFIVNFLREKLDVPALSFEEMMAPIAEDFRRTGMTEDDLDALVEQERQAIWDEKNIEPQGRLRRHGVPAGRGQSNRTERSVLRARTLGHTRAHDQPKNCGGTSRPSGSPKHPEEVSAPTKWRTGSSILLYTGQSVPHATRPKMGHGSRTAIPWVTPSWSALSRTGTAL
jgi:hypothetical protein